MYHLLCTDILFAVFSMVKSCTVGWCILYCTSRYCIGIDTKCEHTHVIMTHQHVSSCIRIQNYITHQQLEGCSASEIVCRFLISSNDIHLTKELLWFNFSVHSSWPVHWSISTLSIIYLCRHVQVCNDIYFISFILSRIGY